MFTPGFEPVIDIKCYPLNHQKNRKNSNLYMQFDIKKKKKTYQSISCNLPKYACLKQVTIFLEDETNSSKTGLILLQESRFFTLLKTLQINGQI